MTILSSTLVALLGASICAAVPLVWVPNTRMAEWYLPWERCVFDLGVIDNLKPARDSCSSPSETTPPFYNFVCHAGGTYHGNYAVNNGHKVNMSELIFFKMAFAGYDDPKQQFLKHALENLVKANGSIALFGDSLMFQFYNYLSCEMVRENITHFSWAVPFSSVKVNGVPVPIHFKQFGLTGKDIFHHIIDRWEQALDAGDTLLLIMESSLHYNDMDLFVQDMTDLFALIKTMVEKYKGRSKFIGLLWYESPAQHWDTPTGYHLPRHSKVLSECQPLETKTGDWRNTIIHEHYYHGSKWAEEMKVHDHFMMEMLPMRAITEDMWQMHMKQAGSDCTHYMYTPLMFQPVYHIMENMTHALFNRRKYGI